MKDLATTAFSIINVDKPEKWQGRDLVNTNSNEAFFFAPWSDYLFGYREGNMKYIFNETQNKIEVYDLNVDPEEKINLYNKTTNEAIEQARLRIAAWVQFQDKFFKESLESAE
jgi:hypothetical protein